MTECQRCAGQLKYTLAAFTGDGDPIGTIEMSCEPCIARLTRLLEDDVEYITQEAAYPNRELKPIRGATVCLICAAISLLGWGILAATIYTITRLFH